MATASACAAYDSAMVHYLDSVYETVIPCARSTTHTAVTHCDGNARHPCDLGANLGCNVRQHPPETAAGTAVADGQKLVPRTNAKPDRIQFIAANQMNQASLTAASYVFERFLFRYAPSELGVDPQCRLPQKETAQINGIVLTLFGVTTDTRVHNPMGIGFLYEVFYHLRGEYHLAWYIEGLVYLDHLVLGQVEEVVTFEEPVIQDFSNDGHLCRPGSEEAVRKCLLDELHEP